MTAARERERADRAAAKAMDELAASLEEIDRRRRTAGDVRARLADHRVAALVTAGGLAAGGVAVAALALRHRDERQRRRQARRRWKGLKRAWEHPERVAAGADLPPTRQVARRVAVAFAVALGTKLARQVAAALTSDDVARTPLPPYLGAPA